MLTAPLRQIRAKGINGSTVLKTCAKFTGQEQIKKKIFYRPAKRSRLPRSAKKKKKKKKLGTLRYRRTSVIASRDAAGCRVRVCQCDRACWSGPVSSCRRRPHVIVAPRLQCAVLRRATSKRRHQQRSLSSSRWCICQLL